MADTASAEQEQDGATGQILGIYHININVKNLEESQEFYEMLGFRTIARFDELDDALDRGIGFPDYPGHIKTRAVFMKPPGQKGVPATVLDLVEWDDPKCEGEVPSITNFGIPRICLRVDDCDAAFEKFKSKGIEFVSAPQTISSLDNKPTFVCFKDPNGVILEFVSF